MKKMAVVGVGYMGTVRTEAFLNTGEVTLCAVASAHATTAFEFGKKYGCANTFDDYRRISECQPDFVLVETPHDVQHDVVTWALRSRYPVLIGGSPARTVVEAQEICQLASDYNLVVEAGYEARYKGVWEKVRQLLADKKIGSLVSVRAVALFEADPQSWYYDEKKSGGMPITHMTYAFINPLRWLLGDPLYVSAFANKKNHKEKYHVDEETVIANFMFPEQVLCSLTAGYVCGPSMNADENWHLIFLGTQGELHVCPSDMGEGSIDIVIDGYKKSENLGLSLPFEKQASVFVAAMDGNKGCLNLPQEFVKDIQCAEAIVRSAKDCETVKLTSSHFLRHGETGSTQG